LEGRSENENTKKKSKFYCVNGRDQKPQHGKGTSWLGFPGEIKWLS